MTGPDYRPGDRVRGSFDSGIVVRTDGSGPNASVLIEWDPIDSAGVNLGPGRQTWRQAYTLSLLEPEATPMAADELARHLRAVARRVATRPWTTNIETVLRELADALDPPAPQDPG